MADAGDWSFHFPWRGFPPYKVAMHFCNDGRFRWSAWPAILEFHRDEDGVKVSISTPGGAVFHGTRVGLPGEFYFDASE